MADPDLVPADGPPSTIGKYRFERPLASGGMGELWVARDERLQRNVAIKLMHRTQDASHHRLERFQREARTIALLQHPHVVQVYDFGLADDGTPYIVMELLAGEDLARLLRRTKSMSLAALMPFIVQAAKGLHAAHRAGIIHRDLKPANLFVARQGEDHTLKILDFGIAAVRDTEGANEGDSSILVGTPSYMSPEQARGAPVDHRTDLWSLAVVAYEALTGTSPFADESMPRVATRILEVPHVPPSRHVNGLGPEVDAFFERALAKNRSDRFSSALEFGAAFSALENQQQDRPAKILVVDDEPDLEELMRMRFRRKIRKGQYDLVFARNGQQALDRLQAHPDVDVVLTDINMPGMDGLTLLDRLGRAGPALRSVVVSAYGDMENIRAAMNAGAYDFLTKPLDFKDLEKTIEKALRDARELRRALRSIEENDALRLFVDDALMERLLPLLRISSEVSGETIEGTVACIDVFGVRERAEQGAASGVFDLLNRSFDLIVPIINAWQGVVVRFVGDGVLTVFQGEDHLLRAASACLAIRTAMSEACDDTDDSLSGVCMGLDSGAILSGSVGSRTIQRLDYTVLGRVVSQSFHLERLADRGEILMREEIAQRLDSAFKSRALEREGTPDALGPLHNLEYCRDRGRPTGAITLEDQLTDTVMVKSGS
ncbi:MAG: protein kinase [Myxococcota bacterium]